jgi:dTDP-glucose pyrophosphorylase
MNPELVVMAAGMGSRFGGLKQLEPVGPSGETVMDYSLFDARRAGVRRVVFVIRRDLEALFRERIGSRYEAWLDVAYAYQELQALPPGHGVPEGRTKPWGTAQAVLSAREAVRAPFMVINADDFYGERAYRLMVERLRQPEPEGHPAFAMVAFQLARTLSSHGTVARGICAVDGKGRLLGVEEHTSLERDGEGALELRPEGRIHFTGKEPVSMNFWGFTQRIFPALASGFEAFLRQDPGLKGEFYLPAVVDGLVARGKATVDVLHTPDSWFGVTYREDREEVVARIQALVAEGAYPEDLWRRP